MHFCNWHKLLEPSLVSHTHQHIWFYHHSTAGRGQIWNNGNMALSQVFLGVIQLYLSDIKSGEVVVGFSVSDNYHEKHFYCYVVRVVSFMHLGNLSWFKSKYFQLGFYDSRTVCIGGTWITTLLTLLVPLVKLNFFYILWSLRPENHGPCIFSVHAIILMKSSFITLTYSWAGWCSISENLLGFGVSSFIIWKQ